MSAETTDAETANSVSLTSLSTGAQLFIQSIRSWAQAARERRCIKRDLIPLYLNHDCLAAMEPLDELMNLLALAAYRPVQLNGACAAELTGDELTLLQAMRAMQRNHPDIARNQLSGLIAGRLNHTWRRVATAYLSELSVSGLTCTGLRHMTLVQGEPA